MRLSGTGTVGAALRLYIEKYETNLNKIGIDNHEALADIVKITEQITNIQDLTGRDRASLVT